MVEFQKYHVQKGQIVKVPSDLLNEFGRGDAYLIDTGRSIFLWIGENASPDEKFVGAITSVWRDQDRKGTARLITINQGEEPQEFLDLFGGAITVTDLDTDGIIKRVALKQREFQLFRVHIEKDLNLFYEVPRSKSSLTSDDVYLLDTFNQIYIWRGKESTGREKFEAMLIARRYDSERAGVQEIILVEEGKEPAEFFKVLK